VDLPQKESFWGTKFEGVHVVGRMYFMSLDLCRGVADDAAYSKDRIAAGGYLEVHKDHDIAAMVFHSPTPIQMVDIGKLQ
jgi:hypothetical protein